MVASLEAVNTILPSPLSTYPMLSLVVTLTIFKAILDSNSVVLKDKEQVSEVGDYLSKWLVN